MFKVLWFKIRNLPYFLRSLAVPISAFVGSLGGAMTTYGKLQVSLVEADGTCTDFGTVGYRVITGAGVAYIADAFADTFSRKASDFNYHASGTGTAAELASQTALGAEVTDNARPSGTRLGVTTATGADYRTVGLIAYTSSHAITEHGIFNQATRSGSTMLDRTKFAAINVINGQSLNFAYQLSIAYGG